MKLATVSALAGAEREMRWLISGGWRRVLHVFVYLSIRRIGMTAIPPSTRCDSFLWDPMDGTG